MCLNLRFLSPINCPRASEIAFEFVSGKDYNTACNMCGGQSVAERIRPIVHLVFACDNMNEKPRDDTSIGQLMRAASKSIRPPVLDCSGWDAENPSEQWSTG